jgi:hypothetical protein
LTELFLDQDLSWLVGLQDLKSNRPGNAVLAGSAKRP